MAWSYTTYATPSCEGVPIILTSAGSSTDVYNETVFTSKYYFDGSTVSPTKWQAPLQFGDVSVSFPYIGVPQVYEWGETCIGTPKGPQYKGDYIINYAGMHQWLNNQYFLNVSMPLGVQICFSVTEGWTHPYYSSKPNYVFWS